MMGIWSWLKRWGGLVGGAVLLLLGAGWMWGRERRLRLSAQAQAEVDRLAAANATAKAVRERLMEEAQGEDSTAIRDLDSQIAANERQIVEHHDDRARGLTRDEIRGRLRELGY